MINHSETLTGGIHHILYGIRKPAAVFKRYEQKQTECDLCHVLNSYPGSPEAYVDLHESLCARWGPYLIQYKDLFREWLPPFYILPDEQFCAFHILCDFYSSYIRAECRMMIQVSEAWKQDLAISTLRYELLTLRNELIELIRESVQRLANHQSNSPEGNLNSFVFEQLKYHLLITFFELQLRSGHLFEERLIPRRELFLKYLKQPELRAAPWQRTAGLTQFELELLFRNPDRLKQFTSVENLLKKVRCESSGRKTEAQDSVNLLENVWFCLFIMNRSGQWSTLDLSKPEQCSKKIEEVHRQLNQNGAGDNRAAPDEIIRIVIHEFEKVQSVLTTGTPGETSSAGRFIRSIESHFESNLKTQPGRQPKPDSPLMVRERVTISMLDEYIPVDRLKEKLDVTDKSLLNYLRESQIPVINFSSKIRLIHARDLKALMDHYKKTL